jgi:uncharacterized membrane protein
MAMVLKMRNPALTYLDLLKTLAVILMIIDHIGFYFMPSSMPLVMGEDVLWWRVLGRLCVPIWFFLIGYARSRDLSLSIWLGAIFLVMVNMITGMFLLPLNVLVSMIFIRLVIDDTARFMFLNRTQMVVGCLFLAFLSPAVENIIEYGLTGLLLALFGYVARHGQAAGPVMMGQNVIFGFCFFVFFAFTISQFLLLPHLSVAQGGVLFGGLIAVFLALWYMPKSEYWSFGESLPAFLRRFFQFCGRHSLIIYVVHLTLFKFICLIFGLGLPIYGWFDWHFTIHESFAAHRFKIDD